MKTNPLDLTLIIVAIIALIQGIIVALISRTRKDAQSAAKSAKEDRLHHTAIEWKLDQITQEIRAMKQDLRHVQERFDFHLDGGH